MIIVLHVHVQCVSHTCTMYTYVIFFKREELQKDLHQCETDIEKLNKEKNQLEKHLTNRKSELEEQLTTLEVVHLTFLFCYIFIYVSVLSFCIFLLPFQFT